MKTKNNIIEFLFGDIFDWLYENQISPALFSAIILSVVVYFLYIKKHKKGNKYTKQEKLYIGILIFIWILTVISQVAIITQSKGK